MSSPGYETCSSTAPASSPDPCEYGFEGSIDEYKSRSNRINGGKAVFSKDSTPDRVAAPEVNKFIPKRPSVTKIEDRLINFELKSSTNGMMDGENATNAMDKMKKELPKVDIGKRREMFEREKTPDQSNNRLSGEFGQNNQPIVSIKERLCNLEKVRDESNGNSGNNRLSGEITSIKDRLSNLEKEIQQPKVESSKINVAIGSLKERMNSLQSAVQTNGVKKEVEEVLEVEVMKVSPVVVAMEKKPIEEKVHMETLKVEVQEISINKSETEKIIVEVVEKSVQETVRRSSVPKEEYREITDEDLFGSCDLNGAEDDDIEIDSLQQDVSVSSNSISNSISTSSIVLASKSNPQIVSPGQLEVAGGDQLAGDAGVGPLLNHPPNSVTYNFSKRCDIDECTSARNGDGDVVSSNGSGGHQSIANTFTSRLGSLLSLNRLNNNNQTTNTVEMVGKTVDKKKMFEKELSLINSNVASASSLIRKGINTMMTSGASDTKLKDMGSNGQNTRPNLTPSNSDFFNTDSATSNNRHCILLIDNKNAPR